MKLPELKCMEDTMTNYIDAEKLKRFVESIGLTPQKSADYNDGRDAVKMMVLDFIDSLQQEQPKNRLIQVKCIHPYDESWEKDKVYTCNVWHHSSLNIDFWDVYYDYGNNLKYVQFSTIKLLNKEFAIIQEESQVIPEQLEMDFRIEERKWVHDAVDNIFPEDGDFMSEVDFRKILKDTDRHFYEFGFSANKK